MARFKKVLSLLLCLIMVLSNVPVQAFAAGGASNVTMSVDKTAVNIGDTVSVTVSCTGMKVSSFTAGIVFDQELLEIKSIVSDDPDYPEDFGLYASSKGSVTWVPATAISTVAQAEKSGQVGFALAGTKDTNYAASILFTVTFTANKEGNAVFTLYEDTAGTDEYKSSSIATTSVTIAAPASCTLSFVSGQAATCGEDGWNGYYKCSDETCGKLYSDANGTTEITELAAWKIGAGKLPATNDHVDGDDKDHDCDNCDAKNIEGHTESTKPETTDATCTVNGKVETVTFCTECGAELGREVTDTLPAAHTWGTATYTWSADFATCTAAHECEVDGCNGKEEKTVNSSSQITTPATCGEKGSAIYTAEFDVAWAETQTRTVEIPATGGHGGSFYFNITNYDTWSDADLVFYCKTCRTEVKSFRKLGSYEGTPKCTEDINVQVTYDFSDINLPDNISWDNFTQSGNYNWNAETGILTDERPIWSVGHKFSETTEAKASTCVAGGNEAYKQCTVCELYFAADADVKSTDGKNNASAFVTGIDSSNHSYPETGTYTEGDCQTYGYTTYVCDNGCGVDNVVYDTAYGDHSYGELIPAVEEIHTKEDLQPAVAAHHFCDVCDTYFTEAKVETTLEELTGETPEHTVSSYNNNPNKCHYPLCSCGYQFKMEKCDYSYDAENRKCICGEVQPVTVIVNTQDDKMSGGTIGFTYGTPMSDVKAVVMEKYDGRSKPGYEWAGWKFYASEEVDFETGTPAYSDEYTGTTVPAHNLYAVGQWNCLHTTTTAVDNEDGTHKVVCANGCEVEAAVPHTYDEANHKCVCGVAEKFTINWKVNDEIIKSETLEYGAEVVAPDYEVPAGYDFSGWTNVPETMPAEDLTFNATLTAKTYKLRLASGIKSVKIVSVNGQPTDITSASSSYGTITHGQALEIVLENIASQNREDVFVSYYTVGTKQTSVYKNTNTIIIPAEQVTNKVTIEAVALIDFTVDLNGGSCTDATTFVATDVEGVVKLSDALALGDYSLRINNYIEREGYQLTGLVAADGTEYAANNLFKLSGDMALTAQWECLHDTDPVFTDLGDGTHSVTCGSCKEERDVPAKHTFENGMCVCGKGESYNVTVEIAEWADPADAYAYEITSANTTVTHGQKFVTVLTASEGINADAILVEDVIVNDANIIKQCTYDEATGTLTIPAEYVTGEVHINAWAGVKVTTYLHGGISTTPAIVEGMSDYQPYGTIVTTPTLAQMATMIVREGYELVDVNTKADGFGKTLLLKGYVATETFEMHMVWEIEKFTLTVVDIVGEEHVLEVPYGTNIVEYLKKQDFYKDEYALDTEGMTGILTFVSWYDENNEDIQNDAVVTGDMSVYANSWHTGWIKGNLGWGYEIDNNFVFGWQEIDGAWYYFFKDEETLWSYRAEGIKRVPYPTKPINGITYAPAMTDESFIDATEGWFLFDADGKFQSGTTGMGTYNGATRYMENGFLPWHYGLVFDGVNDYYYFIGDETNGGNIMATGDVYLQKDNGLKFNAIGGVDPVEQGVYTFGADGKLLKAQGITEVDGKLRYYENWRLMLGKGLTKVGDKYIYVRSNGELVVGREYWVPANNLNVAPGNYAFDENGFMINPIVSEKEGVYFENGAWKYYENGLLAMNKGLLKVENMVWHDADGNQQTYSGVIYVRSNGVLATGNYWITNTNGLEGFVSGNCYNFGELGICATQKNGIIAEGGTLYYYKDNMRQYNAGVIELNGKYYYVRSNAEVVNGRSYWITNTNNLVVAKQYTFDADGVMQNPALITTSGIVNGYYYENGAIAYGKGLVKLSDENGEFYIYVRSNGQLATGKYWPTNTNGYDVSGQLDFGTNGKYYI